MTAIAGPTYGKQQSERWKLRFANLDKAFALLQRACALGDLSELERMGLIKSFEIAFELAWKTMKDLLEYEGVEVDSPRKAIGSAFQAGLIADARPWLDALDSRNLMTYTDSEEAAAAAVAIIKNEFAPMLAQLIETLRARLSEGESG